MDFKQPISHQAKMISYVECLGGEGAGHGMAAHCWNAGPDEERDELLPRKMAALQPKTGGSLRRRLLSARIHQHHDAILAMSAGGAGRLETPTSEKKPLPPHSQYPGHSPWYRHQHFSPRPHVHPSLTPEAYGKLFSAPEACGKPNLQSHPVQLQRPACPVFSQQSRTGSRPPAPERRHGYTLPVPSPLIGPTYLSEPEVPPQYRYRPGRKRKTKFFCFGSRKGRNSGMEATQTTPLLHKGTARNSGLLVSDNLLTGPVLSLSDQEWS